MKYILYSPPHEKKVPGFTKTNGEQVPDRVFKIGARALYRHKRYRDRRYRRDYPDFDQETELLVCNTINEAIREQGSLKAYSGEMFEIRTYDKGKIGGIEQ